MQGNGQLDHRIADAFGALERPDPDQRPQALSETLDRSRCGQERWFLPIGRPSVRLRSCGRTRRFGWLKET
jgi:hypothetical protein